MKLLAAALLACSNADPATIKTIEKVSIEFSLDPTIILAIACKESGISGVNPLGVNSCTGNNAVRAKGPDWCILLGVVSYQNRLLVHKTEEKALAAYNNSKHRKKYAESVGWIAKKIRNNLVK